jgi:hypothetical protein
MNNILKNILSLFHSLLISSIVTLTIGLLLPKGLFFSSGIIVLLLLSRLYSKARDERSLSTHLLFIAAIAINIGLSLLLFQGACLIFPTWSSCIPNLFQATVFAIIFFPTALGVVLWIAFQLLLIRQYLLLKQRK